jgi:hypothetical protein
MWWGVSIEDFLFFVFFFSNFVIWKKKFWNFSKSLTKVVKFPLGKKKVMLPILFVQKQQNLSEKKNPHLSQHVRLGGVVGGCAFLSLLVMWVIKYYAKWRTWEDIRCSENVNFTSVGPVYTRTIHLILVYWVQDWFLASMRQV